MREHPRILIVDDNSAERFTLEALFLPQDYNVVVLDSGQKALQVAEEFLPDVILLDVMMPDLNGFEVCRRLRQNPKTADIPILLLTALDDQPSRLRGLESGADDFISRPYSRLELQARIRTITRLNRYRRLLSEKSKFERVVERAEIGYLLVNDAGNILFANPIAALYLDLPQDNSLAVGENFLKLAENQYLCEPGEAWASWPEPLPDKMPRYLVRPESESSQAMWIKVDVLDSLTEETELARLISLRDVTEQMAVQRDRRKFHTMITHKMRTPFISILTGLELLIKHIDDLSPSEVVDLSGDAYKWAKRLYEDVEEILRYVDVSTMLEPGAEFNLTLLPAIVTNICARMDIKKVSISGLANRIGPRVTLSKAALEMVLWEIIGNAKKFHPQQQPVIEVAVAYEEAGEVMIQISDDGMTLAPEQVSQIWMPYYQGEKYFTGQVEGMGLGLSLVASIVWSIGGRCRLYNRAGRTGLTVDLILPCVSQAEVSQE
ncbi:MAG: response regulator [Ardenticatenaceae bacterium]|nr:response regulator [Ardenticatenaceae bacterium]